MIDFGNMDLQAWLVFIGLLGGAVGSLGVIFKKVLIPVIGALVDEGKEDILTQITHNQEMTHHKLDALLKELGIKE